MLPVEIEFAAIAANLMFFVRSDSGLCDGQFYTYKLYPPEFHLVRQIRHDFRIQRISRIPTFCGHLRPLRICLLSVPCCCLLLLLDACMHAAAMHPPWEMTIDRQRSSTFLLKCYCMMWGRTIGQYHTIFLLYQPFSM